MGARFKQVPKAERANEQLRPRPRNAQARRLARVWGGAYCGLLGVAPLIVPFLGGVLRPQMSAKALG